MSKISSPPILTHPAKSGRRYKDVEVIEQELCSDFSIYAASCLKVQSVDGQLVPFSLNEIQHVLEQIICDIRAQGRLVRLIILKARREGVSTWAAGRFFWKTTTDFNRYGVLITHEHEATEFIFNMTRRFQRHVPEDFKPAQLHNNKKEIEFNRAAGMGLDGAIRVGTAGKTDFGSGQLIHYLHLSEVAKWPQHNATDLLTSILQCVPDHIDTEIIFESTAKGPAGEFYERFFGARYIYELYRETNGRPAFKSRINERSRPNNVYNAIFIPWFVFDSYRVPPLSSNTQGVDDVAAIELTDEERSMKESYELDDAQILWRRQAIENRCKGDLLTFKQEYPSNAIEAFVTTSTSVFNTQKIIDLMAEAKEPVYRYECELATGVWRLVKEGSLRVWEEADKNRHYLISADVSEGLEGGDYSCAEVIERSTSKQVAEWHGLIEPDLFGLLLTHLGKRYNMAWLIPERNNHGLTTITKIVELNYPRIYTEMVLTPPIKPRKRLGWLSTRTNKELIINNLIAEIRDDSHGIVSRELFEEMMTFVKTQSGQYTAENGMHDDRVMAIAIGKFVRAKLPPITQSSLSLSISIEAWT
ncbi:MAG: hypothetical protein HQL06_08250 [Nitrospirae bacterium]|nr:hypothetical protein [Nitrospirota bacterium]